MTPTNTRVERKSFDLVFAENVALPHNTQFLGTLFTVSQNANVRTSPESSGRVVAWLREGEVFRAIGTVHGGQWVLVERYGVIIGYVHSDLVVSTKATEAAKGAPKGKTIQQKVSGSTTCRTLQVEVVSKEGGREKKNMNACFRPDGEWEI